MENLDDFPITDLDQLRITGEISGVFRAQSKFIETTPETHQLRATKMPSDSRPIIDPDARAHIRPERTISEDDRSSGPYFDRPVRRHGFDQVAEFRPHDHRGSDDSILGKLLRADRGRRTGPQAQRDQKGEVEAAEIRRELTHVRTVAPGPPLRTLWPGSFRWESWTRYDPRTCGASETLSHPPFDRTTMKTSITWLNDYLDPPLDAATQADVLTAAGFPWDGEGTAENGEPWQEIETTSNRGDCLCHLGLAREAAVIGGSNLVIPKTAVTTGGVEASTSIQVRNQDADACPLYTARIIRGVTVRESPEWLRRRIEAIGLVPRNNLVDATNFVLFELGQPTHVFDLDLLEGDAIEIRRARAGESMQPLGEDAEPIELNTDDLVIADEQRPVALAGVKGGAETAVTNATRNIMLEAATFDPVVVRAASRRHKIASDSSYRFERGVHPAEVAIAADRLAALILEVAGGELAPGVVADGHPMPKTKTVTMRPARCRAILGIEIADEEIERLLAGLELQPRRDGDRFSCTIPSRRLDLDREADLIEEIARTHGLDQLPVAETIHIRAVPPRPNDQALGAIRDLLVGLGFHETVTHTLIGRSAAAPFLAHARRPLEVDDERASAEPALRPSLLPSLLRVSGHNHDLGTATVRLFETGSTFDRGPEGHRETRRLGLVADPPADADTKDADASAQAAFGLLRTTIDRVGGRLGVAEITVTPTEAAGFDAAAEIHFDGDRVGIIGIIAADAAAPDGHERPLAGAELELAPNGLASRLDGWPAEAAATSLPAFPSIDRDLTVLIDEATSWQAIEDAARAADPSTLHQLEDVEFVTVFRGGKLPAGRKAITLRLRFRASDRTLRHEEIDPAVTAVMTSLESLGGEIRR